MGSVAIGFLALWGTCFAIILIAMVLWDWIQNP